MACNNAAPTPSEAGKMLCQPMVCRIPVCSICIRTNETADNQRLQEIKKATHALHHVETLGVLTLLLTG